MIQWRKLLMPSTLTACLLLQAACKTIVRENIISSINTGIGATIAENPQTQMYEIKAGYIRSQFYSIPTGKKVEAAPGDTLFTNAADLTPEVVAGIRMKSDIRHLLLGMEVSESFAVGKVAVMSPAATVMYIANADSRANAVAASAAAEAMSAARKSTETIPLAPTPEMGELYRQLGVLRKSDPAKKAKSLEIIRKPEYGGFATWDEFVDSNPGKETLGKLLNELK